MGGEGRGGLACVGLLCRRLASFLCQPQHTFRMEKLRPPIAPLTVSETLLSRDLEAWAMFMSVEAEVSASWHVHLPISTFMPSLLQWEGGVFTPVHTVSTLRLHLYLNVLKKFTSTHTHICMHTHVWFCVSLLRFLRH